MIGIYGGTFNPVHYGHLRTALEIKEIFGLEQIRLIPCYQPVLKGEPSVTAITRLKMLELAIIGEKELVSDSRELDRQGASYMVDTLSSLRDEFPRQSLLLLIGSDAFTNLEQWYQWQLLFDYAHVIVMTRPDYTNKISVSHFFKTRLIINPVILRQTLAGKLYFQSVTQLAISSTQIREILVKKRSPRFLMPDNVINYIQQNKLYRNLNANQ